MSRGGCSLTHIAEQDAERNLTHVSTAWHPSRHRHCRVW